jgi:hypothetical protein
MSEPSADEHAIQAGWTRLAQTADSPARASPHRRGAGALSLIRKQTVTLHDLSEMLAGGAISGAVCGGMIGLVPAVPAGPLIGPLVFLASILVGAVLLSAGWVAMLVAFWLFDFVVEGCAACLGFRQRQIAPLIVLDRNLATHAADSAIKQQSPGH